MRRQTYLAKVNQVTPRWHHISAEGQVLGRLASRLAVILMGKHRPQYTPNVDTGDFIVVTNAEKVVMTGRKRENKIRTTYVYYPGGQRRRTYGELLDKFPERVIEDAVKRMLPKGRMGRSMASKLKVYRGADHPHQAQKPEAMSA